MTATNVAVRALCGAALLPLLAGCAPSLHAAGTGAQAATTTPAPTPPPPTHQFVQPATMDPTCAAAAPVPISPGRPPDTKLPDYGFGSGPVYLTGQDIQGHAGWYASGQEADFVVDPSYTEGILVSGHQIGGSGTATFDDSSTTIAIKQQPKQSYWRYWEGRLSFTTPGCYEIDLKSGSMLHEHVVVLAAAGTPPPG